MGTRIMAPESTAGVGGDHWREEVSAAALGLPRGAWRRWQRALGFKYGIVFIEAGAEIYGGLQPCRRGAPLPTLIKAAKNRAAGNEAANQPRSQYEYVIRVCPCRSQPSRLRRASLSQLRRLPRLADGRYLAEGRAWLTAIERWSTLRSLTGDSTHGEKSQPLGRVLTGQPDQHPSFNKYEHFCISSSAILQLTRDSHTSKDAQDMTDEDRDPLRNAARRWLLHVIEVTGLSATKLAQESGLAATTITRFINNPDVKHTLSARTIAKIAGRTGIPAPLDISARPDTDPEVMERALAGARQAMARVPDSERARIEALLVAEIYDALISAELAGQSLEEAARAVNAYISRRLRGRQRS